MMSMNESEHDTIKFSISSSNLIIEKHKTQLLQIHFQQKNLWSLVKFIKITALHFPLNFPESFFSETFRKTCSHRRL